MTFYCSQSWILEEFSGSWFSESNFRLFFYICLCLSNFSLFARFFNQGLVNADQAYALDYTLSLKMEPANAGDPSQLFVFQYINDVPTQCTAPRIGGMSGQTVAPIMAQNCGPNKVWSYGRCMRVFRG